MNRGDYSNDQLRAMLINVLNANYGAAPEEIGNGDGLSPVDVAQLREFWSYYLAQMYRASDSDDRTAHLRNLLYVNKIGMVVDDAVHNEETGQLTLKVTLELPSCAGVS